MGGLEIADTSFTNSEISATVERSGSFVHIDPKPGTILVNVGYLLMKWSNGRWKNTVHRVSEPPHWKDQVLQSSKCSDTAERISGSADAIPERYSMHRKGGSLLMQAIIFVEKERRCTPKKLK